jgi:hypothetical protein
MAAHIIDTVQEVLSLPLKTHISVANMNLITTFPMTTQNDIASTSNTKR